MGPQVFNVLTEFRFDIAHAVAGSQTLQGEIGKISDAAQQAQYHIQRIGFGLVAQMGLGTGGVLGFLYQAVQASDKFGQSQRNLANILLSNNKMFSQGGFDFTGAMSQADQIMGHVVGKAREFALDPNDMLSSVKAIAPVLISHGLEKNSQLPISMDIARGFLKSAPTLGIDPQMAQGQLVDLVLGRASMQDRLFQRLASETSPFKDNKINSSQAWNSLPAAKRIELARLALLQFGSNADVLKGNMMSLNGQMTVFMSLIKGQFSIFKSVGDVLIEPIKKILNSVNQWLMTKGKAVADNIAKIIKPLIDDPEKLLATIMQLGRLKKDMSLAGEIFSLAEGFSILRGVMGFFGITFGMVFSKLGAALGWVRDFLQSIGLLSGGAFKTLLRIGRFLATEVLFPLMLLVTILQGISKGISQAKITDAKWIAEHLDKITDLMNKASIVMRKFMLPITMVIDGIAMWTEWLLTFGAVSEAALGWADEIVDTFNTIGNVIVGFFAIIAAVMNPIMANVSSLMSGNIGDIFGKNNKDVFKNMKEGFMDFWNSHANPLEQASKKQEIATQNININSVEINNSFKEQQQPDRIAFTLKEQLIKAAINPTQRGKSFRGGLVGA